MRYAVFISFYLHFGDKIFFNETVIEEKHVFKSLTLLYHPIILLLFKFFVIFRALMQKLLFVVPDFYFIVYAFE